MISQTAEYCLRAVVCLAGAGGQPLTTHHIAVTTKIPPGYLCKVLQALGRAGMVTAQRGLNGGFVLQRDPASLSLLEVIRVADPSQRVTTCPLGIHGTDLCALHRRLDQAAVLVEHALAGATVAGLMTGPGTRPLHALSALALTAAVPALGCTQGDSACRIQPDDSSALMVQRHETNPLGSISGDIPCST
jgi:Rrf2 family transcriptional regulator, nitric oxide-sensitive transcriptional repressor